MDVFFYSFGFLFDFMFHIEARFVILYMLQKHTVFLQTGNKVIRPSEGNDTWENQNHGF